MLAKRRRKANQLKQSALNRGGKFCLGLRNGLLRFAGWPTVARAAPPPFGRTHLFDRAYLQGELGRLSVLSSM